MEGNRQQPEEPGPERVMEVSHLGVLPLSSFCGTNKIKQKLHLGKKTETEEDKKGTDVENLKAEAAEKEQAWREEIENSKLLSGRGSGVRCVCPELGVSRANLGSSLFIVDTFAFP